MIGVSDLLASIHVNEHGHGWIHPTEKRPRPMKHSCDGTTSPPPDRPSRLQRRPAILYLRTPTLLHLGLPLVWRRAAPIHQPEEATGRNEPSASQNRAKRNHCNQHPRASDPAMQCRREALVPPRGLKNAASVAPPPDGPCR
jgi:hypothetical protein